MLPARQRAYPLVKIRKAQAGQDGLRLVGCALALSLIGGGQKAERRLGDAVLRAQMRRLGQIGKRQATLAGDVARVRLLRACQQAQQRGFARAVAAHHADFIALGYRDADVGKQLFFAVMQRYVRQGKGGSHRPSIHNAKFHYILSRMRRSVKGRVKKRAGD